MELTSFVSLETFLDAVFLWINPFLAALSMADTTSSRAVPAVSLFFSATAFSTFFDRVFSMFLADLFSTVSAMVCRALLIADLLFLGAAFAGNVIPPYTQ